MTLPSIMVIVATMLFLILERAFPGRELPNSKGWYGRALWVNLAQLLIILATARKMGSERNGTYLSGFIIDVGRVRHVVCAVTRRMRHRALRKECHVLLRNAWRVTQITLTRPTFGLK